MSLHIRARCRTQRLLFITVYINTTIAVSLRQFSFTFKRGFHIYIQHRTRAARFRHRVRHELKVQYLVREKEITGSKAQTAVLFTFFKEEK